MAQKNFAKRNVLLMSRTRHARTDMALASSRANSGKAGVPTFAGNTYVQSLQLQQDAVRPVTYEPLMVGAPLSFRGQEIAAATATRTSGLRARGTPVRVSLTSATKLPSPSSVWSVPAVRVKESKAAERTEHLAPIHTAWPDAVERF